MAEVYGVTAELVRREKHVRVVLSDQTTLRLYSTSKINYQQVVSCRIEREAHFVSGSRGRLRTRFLMPPRCSTWPKISHCNQSTHSRGQSSYLLEMIMAAHDESTSSTRWFIYAHCSSTFLPGAAGFHGKAIPQSWVYGKLDERAGAMLLHLAL